VTVEDHGMCGGLGSAVAELVGETHPCRVVRIGAPRDGIDHVGSHEDLLDRAGITVDSVVDAAHRIVSAGRAGSATVRPRS
jgi:transketolase